MHGFPFYHHSLCVSLCQCTPQIIRITAIMHGRAILYDSWFPFIVCPQVDRSPCGSGTTARIAVQFAKGQIGLGQERISQSGITGSCFTAKVHAQTTCGDIPAVVVAVSGKAHYIGSSVFTLEEDDDQKGGFTIRWILNWYLATGARRWWRCRIYIPLSLCCFVSVCHDTSGYKVSVGMGSRAENPYWGCTFGLNKTQQELAKIKR